MSTEDKQRDRVDAEARQPGGAAFHQTLIIIFTALLLAGGSGGSGRNALSTIVSDVVPDGPRRARAEEITDRIAANEDQTIADVVDWRLELYGVLGSYDAQPWEVLAAFDEGFSRVEDSERALLDLRYELRDTLTPQEWEAMHRRLSE